MKSDPKTSMIGFAVFAVCALAALSISGCTDASQAKMFNYGQEGRVTCYSGGNIYFDDVSTGRIQKEESGGDGYYFVAKSTNRLTEVTGDCVVDYGFIGNIAPVRAR